MQLLQCKYCSVTVAVQLLNGNVQCQAQIVQLCMQTCIHTFAKGKVFQTSEIFPKKGHNLRHFIPQILIFKYFYSRVAGVGWLSGTAAESLRAFGERVFANFCDKNVVFYNCGKTGHLWLSKDLHTHRHVHSNTLFDV